MVIETALAITQQDNSPVSRFRKVLGLLGILVQSLVCPHACLLAKA